MKVSIILRMLLTVLVAGLLVMPVTPANSHPNSQKTISDKPPDSIQGGEWSDDFLTWQLSAKENTEIQAGHLLLRLDETLHWTQTWTAHFAGGEFFQTEAISDSVSLAANGAGQYFTIGAYTSTVFNAGKPVDWSSSKWTFSRIPESLKVEYRTGNTPSPDLTWTSWLSPRKVFLEYLCVYIINVDKTECTSNMSGMDSSQYIQYRASFSSDDPARTVVLYDIDLLYGTHPVFGTATSMVVAPVDLREWDQVIISSTIPASTTLTMDILAPDGTVLLQNVGDGDSLASIDPVEVPAIKLRASFTTTDTSLTPDIDLWGLRWSVTSKLYLPVVCQ